MRFVFLLLILFNFIFANILSLDKAFNVALNSDKQVLYINFKLGDEIYLYKDKITIKLNEKDITKLLNFPTPIIKDNEYIYYKNLSLAVPNILLDQYTQKKDSLLQITYQGCSNQGLCYQPQKINYSLKEKNNIYIYSKINKIKQQNLTSASEESIIEKFINTENLFTILITFFGYGLLLSLTPCTLPMIPILSSLIMSKVGISKKYSFFLSFIYVFFMSLAYAIAGIIASYIGASVQGLLQKPVVLIFFSLIFVLFSLAMFEVFNFELPSKFQNFIHKKTNQCKGIISIAIMGFLSALIVGPCVAAPLAGALLYIANSGDMILGGLALFTMSFGMGIPLLFIGLGIGFIKPGQWMKKIKILFGFIMLGMAIWILERILDFRFILIGYGVLGVFFCVFMGIFDKAKNFLNSFKKSLLILILSLSITLFLAGIFNIKEVPNFLSNQTQKYNFLNFTYISNLDELLNVIKNSQKKVMIDFTATWCENCKLLDNITFKDPAVIKELNEYKLIKVDVSENNEEQIKIMKHFNVFGPPVLIFFQNNQEKLKITGFIKPQDLLKKISFDEN
ncbi:protein-disulfide reductase DsbD [Campylobacter novaezeelandiae]|uniref:protein-disulfide reductase DsbD n=1 Tax=Campylobacter novaezeelandiae TaxID=2267891 RepID=UPI001902E8FF|nr:protein-disulfide reductase DsbD [Campylobacter novaezeelandiae]MBK1964069.1 protein-disulfide reductase DsbD [Campylobacter novaezeelandiae]MBK1993072.1 protein-disulfide reductase DsbD [Campylobacter novaezeelandiae]